MTSIIDIPSITLEQNETDLQSDYLSTQTCIASN